MATPRATGDERVTYLELFFDLVFVFAFTQVTGLMAAEGDWAGVGQGLLVLAALWCAWAGYAWLTNRVNPEEGDARSRMARDSWSYLHLPMVAGIILFALGVKKTLAHVGEPLELVGAAALCGGLAVYLAALVAFRLRNMHSLNKQRVLTVAVLLALIPVAHEVDALPALSIVAAACCGLIAYEAVRFREVRDRVRHAQEIAVSP